MNGYARKILWPFCKGKQPLQAGIATLSDKGGNIVVSEISFGDVSMKLTHLIRRLFKYGMGHFSNTLDMFDNKAFLGSS